MLKDLFLQFRQKFDKEPQEDTAIPAEPEKSAATLTTDKIKAIVAELSASNEIFKEAGFIMEQLEIEVGLVPKITPQYRQFKEISQEEESQIMAQLTERKMIGFVLTSLFKSSRMKFLLEDTDMYFYGIEIEITTSPSVKTIFKREHSLNKPLDITRH